MKSIYDIYTEYNNVVKYSEYALTGWASSWILFFIMLPYMIRLFGKVKGAFFNYCFSWLWYATI